MAYSDPAGDPTVPVVRPPLDVLPHFGVPTSLGSKKVDYEGMLAGDQQLQEYMAQLRAQLIGYGDQRTESRNRALIDYGFIPDASALNSLSTGDVAGDITDQTRQLAEQNTAGGASTIAQLRHLYNQNQSGTVGDLGARGLINSSALKQHTGENLYNYNIAGHQAGQQLTDYLAGLQSGYLEHQRSITDQGVNATDAAVKRITDMINSGLIAGTGTAKGTSTSTGSSGSTGHAAPGFYPGGAPTANASYLSGLPGGAPTATANYLSGLPGGAPTANARIPTTSTSAPRVLGSAAPNIKPFKPASFGLSPQPVETSAPSFQLPMVSGNAAAVTNPLRGMHVAPGGLFGGNI